MTKLVYILSVLFFMGNSTFIDTTNSTDIPPIQKQISAAKSNIQVALLLDTSGSMDGLIDQAKSQIWKMVNELATAKKDGLAPDIEIALYQYGNDNISAKDGYVQQILALTTDLDQVSEKLFELSTNGGEEYCGYAIKDAVKDLEWSESNDDLKIIIIAGNESFAQGPINYKQSCKTSITNGIIINTIHCGDYKKGIRDHWKDGADLTDGKYMNINQDDKVVHIPTPFDDTIMELNKKLNETYIGYGAGGQEKKERQMAQDANAMSYGKANARERASFKAKESYSNEDWDLVDAEAENDEILEELEPAQLPDEMKDMDKNEQKKYIDELRQKREAIKKEISENEAKAKTFVANQQKENAEALTLDNVMMNAVKEQAKGKKFKFD